MTSNNPPSPSFTGINFNTDFFPSAAGDYVDYPTAQGPVTISTLYSSAIDTLSSSTAFNLLNTLTANLNLAINGTTGQTIRIGAYTGASVHCANIDHQNNSINHATNASGGTLNLCNNMTTGILNIGTNTARSGTINIGDGVGATGSIDIGSSTTPTTVGGTLLSTNAYYLSGVSSSVTNSALTGRIRVEVNQGSRTITLSSYNNNAVFVNTGTGGGGGVFTLPPVASAIGYTFTFRSVQSTATTTVEKAASDSNCIFPTTASAYTTAGAVGTVIIASGKTATYISDGSFWVQI